MSVSLLLGDAHCFSELLRGCDEGLVEGIIELTKAPCVVRVA